MQFEIAIRCNDDLLAARSSLRQLIRDVGWGLVHEAQLVAGLSDAAERLYPAGRAGRIVLGWDGDCIQAVLEREHPEAEEDNSQNSSLLYTLAGLRFMWDDVAVDAPGRSIRVVLRSWPTG